MLPEITRRGLIKTALWIPASLATGKSVMETVSVDRDIREANERVEEVNEMSAMYPSVYPSQAEEERIRIYEEKNIEARDDQRTRSLAEAGVIFAVTAGAQLLIDRINKKPTENEPTNRTSLHLRAKSKTQH